MYNVFVHCCKTATCIGARSSSSSTHHRCNYRHHSRRFIQYSGSAGCVRSRYFTLTFNPVGSQSEKGIYLAWCIACIYNYTEITASCESFSILCESSDAMNGQTVDHHIVTQHHYSLVLLNRHDHDFTT